jgi:hypothetical protein
MIKANKLTTIWKKSVLALLGSHIPSFMLLFIGLGIASAPEDMCYELIKTYKPFYADSPDPLINSFFRKSPQVLGQENGWHYFCHSEDQVRGIAIVFQPLDKAGTEELPYFYGEPAHHLPYQQGVIQHFFGIFHRSMNTYTSLIPVLLLDAREGEPIIALTLKEDIFAPYADILLSLSRSPSSHAYTPTETRKRQRSQQKHAHAEKASQRSRSSRSMLRTLKLPPLTPLAVESNAGEPLKLGTVREEKKNFLSPAAGILEPPLEAIPPYYPLSPSIFSPLESLFPLEEMFTKEPHFYRTPTSAEILAQALDL